MKGAKIKSRKNGDIGEEQASMKPEFTMFLNGRADEKKSA
jgi:hypothetical protein